MRKATAAIMVLFLLAGVGQAGVLIDGTGPGYILNGSFESGTDSVPSDWQTGLNVTVIQRLENNASDGEWSLVIGEENDFNVDGIDAEDNPDGDGIDENIGALINTGHIVSAGETFDLTFDWAEAFQWDTDDRLDWRLLTTDDDTVDGVVTEIASGFATTDSLDPVTYQSESYLGIGTVAPANVGRQLWLEFYSSTAELEGVSAEFARLDQVNLSYIPEPATMSLLALGGLGVLIRRRK